MNWLCKYQVVIDCTHSKVSLFTNNRHAIRMSSILKSCIGDRKKLETYDSLFAINGEKGTGYAYLGL